MVKIEFRHIRIENFVLQHYQYCCTIPQLLNVPLYDTLLVSEDFWDYVFSDEWKDYSSLRVEEGQLLDKLLGQLFILEEKQNLRGFQMSQFDVIKTNRKGCLVEHETETKGKVYSMEHTYMRTYVIMSCAYTRVHNVIHHV